MKTTHPANTRHPAARRWITSLLHAWLLAGALLLPAGLHAAGVTIITHGYNPSVSGTPAWLASLRDDIATNFLNGAQNYGTITVPGTLGSLTATCSPWNVALSSGYSRGGGAAGVPASPQHQRSAHPTTDKEGSRPGRTTSGSRN